MNLAAALKAILEWRKQRHIISLPCSSPLGMLVMVFWALNVELPQAHFCFHMSNHEPDRAGKSKQKVTYSVCKQHCTVFLEVNSKTLNMTRYAYKCRQSDILMYVCIVPKRETKKKSQVVLKLQSVCWWKLLNSCVKYFTSWTKSCLKIGPYKMCDGIALCEFTCIWQIWESPSKLWVSCKMLTVI